MIHRLVACVLCLLMLAPRLVAALDLGAIEARSALYEPLDARIPLDDIRNGDLEELKVALGSPAQFELAGVTRMSHLNFLRFTVVEQGDGDSYIRVWTEEPVIERSLTFLIDVDWSRGHTVRGYKLHLASAAGGETAGASPDRRTEPEAAPGAETSASGATPASPSASSGATYGPVRASDTLWSIAARFRPDDSISVQRMMLALLEANPEAFAIGNVNALNAGVTLRIPTVEEIGPDDLQAAIAEVERQSTAWEQYREGVREVPATPAVPAQRVSEPEEPRGRVEVVSPETAMTAAGREEGAGIQALRNELALAVEAADAGRRENDELKLRLTEAEDHIKELSRLVDLKNEEIAALQTELRAMAEEVSKLGVATSEEAEPKPVLAPEEAAPQPAPAPAPEEAEPKPVLAPEEEAAAEPGPVPALEEAEPRSLPFDLGALPVNPVFLVGGAGLILILLGILALLRRRRASAEEDDALDVAEQAVSEEASLPVPEEDNILQELEAVAAELADDPADVPDRQPRAARTAGLIDDPEIEPTESDARRPGPDRQVEERMAELWEDHSETERAFFAETDGDDDTSEMTFDIDALVGEDSDLGRADDAISDDFDISDLADLAELAGEREAGPARRADEASGDLDSLFSHHDTEASDSGESVPATGTGGPSSLDADVLDGESKNALFATPDDGDSMDSDSGADGVAAFETDRRYVPAPEEDVDFEPDLDDDSGDSELALRSLLGDSENDGEQGMVSLEDFGEDEVQTKIDLAQVYMEMGDTESARGFLEAVLAEGDAEQQDTAREMLSRLA